MNRKQRIAGAALTASSRTGMAILMVCTVLACLVGFMGGGRSSLAGLSAPSASPANICGSSSLTGPSTAPPGSVTIPAGLDSGQYNTPSTTYYFASGTHTLGSGQYTQIDPGNGDTYIGSSGAVVSGQQVNDYAFAGSGTNVTIKFLTIEDFGIYTSDTSDAQGGVVNQDSSSGWTIEDDTITQNGGAGAMLGTNNSFESNCLSENGQYGFQTYSANGDKGGTLTCSSPGFPTLTNVSTCVIGNEFYNNDEGAYDAKTGCGCGSTAGKFWTTQGAVFEGNYVHTDSQTDATFTGDPCVWADTDNSGVTIEDNYLSGCNAEGIMVEASYFNSVSYNTITDSGGGYVANSNIAGFPLGGIYVSESGYDSRAPDETGGQASITGNVFNNVAGGVVLWENSNRFCGDGSDGVCTLVDAAAKSSTCPTSSTKATSETLYYDCRWRTQDIAVTDNTFNLTVASVPNCNQSSNYCGSVGVFSEYASYTPYTVAASPDTCDNEGAIASCTTPVPNSPWAIPQLITADQGNTFSDNTYNGPWKFMTGNQGNFVSWAAWQAGSTDNSDGSGLKSPAQDAGSTYNGSGGGTTTTTAPTTTTTIPTTTTTTGSTTTTTQAPTYTGPTYDTAASVVGQSAVTTPTFSTGPQELVVAIATGRGPTGQSFAITGGGLTWTLVSSSHAGTSSNQEWTQVYTAESVSAIANTTVTATATDRGGNLRLAVVAAK